MSCRIGKLSARCLRVSRYLPDERSALESPSGHIFDSEARIDARGLVRVDRNAVRALDDSGLRYGIGNPAKLAFVLPQLLFRTLPVVNVSHQDVPAGDTRIRIAERFARMMGESMSSYRYAIYAFLKKIAEAVLALRRLLGRLAQLLAHPELALARGPVTEHRENLSLAVHLTLTPAS